MTTPNSAFNDLITTTLQGYSGKIADNVTNHNALMKQINAKGNKMPATGRTIVQELEYAVNGTTQWFSGAEQFDVSASEVLTAAEFNYKQAVGSVVINGLEQIQNSGREAVHNLLKARMSNLNKSMTNMIATGLYADGTGSSGKEMGGLQLLVADVNTNAVGGITATGNGAFWQNYVYDFSNVSLSASAATIQHAMNLAWINTIRGADKPDIIPADAAYFIYYLESLTANQRFTDDKKAGAGFPNLVYMATVPVIYDDQCPLDHMYFLNTDYIYLRPAKGKEFVPLSERNPVNQDATVRPMVWAGNMTTSNRSLQAVIHD